MAQQELKLLIQGLYTYPNPFSAVPPGALLRADNIVIDRPSQADSRRGQKQYGDPLTDAEKLFSFRDKLLIFADDEFFVDTNDDGTLFDAIPDSSGLAQPYASTEIQADDLNKSFYITTDAGVKKLADPEGDMFDAGMAKALDTQAELSVAGAGFFPADSQIAYRIVWGIRDENAVLILGAPSVRGIVINPPGAPDTVDLEFTIPASITEAHFYQIYRSKPSVSDDATPDDELQLVFEKHPSGAEITAGVVSLTDVTPEEQKGAFLYTNPSQEGALQANTPPPLSGDVVEFKQHLFYANLTHLQRVSLTMIENATIGDIISIDGVDYTAAAVESIAADEFEVGATVADTLDSLIRVVNRSASTLSVYVYSLGPSDILIEARTFAEPLFIVDCDNPDLFNLTVPTNSDPDRRQNGIAISKFQEGDAVPLLNRLYAGSADREVLRVLATRDVLFALKKDGIHRITGFSLADFTLEPHDLTFEIVAPDAAVSFDSFVVAYSTEGPIKITPSGVERIGDPIKETLLQISQFDDFSDLAWAAAYNSDDKYLLGVPDDNADPEVTQIFVFNGLTNSWTRWIIDARHALVNPRNDRLYMIRASDDQITEERKAFDITDYADDEFDVTIDTFTSTTVTLLAVPAGVVVGMTLSQDTNDAVITEINGLVLTVTPSDLPWTAAAAKIFTPILNRLFWIEDAAGNPGMLKRFNEMTLLFRDARFEEIDVLASTNFSSGLDIVTLEAQGMGEWGEFSWPDEGDETEWGGGIGGFQPIRTFFPRDAVFGHWMTLGVELEQAFNAFSLVGASVVYTDVNTKFQS